MVSYKPVPVASPSQSYWMTPPSSIDKYRSDDFLEECDIAIIGSGYAGATMAYYMLKSNPTLSIAMLEARGACSGATGRNGGHLKPDVYVSYNKFKELYGHEGARQMFDYEYSHLAALDELIKEHKIDCQFRLTRAMDTLMTQEQLDYAMTNLKAAREAGIDVSMVEVHDDPEAASKIKGAVGALSLPAGCLSPYNFITGILKICLSKGLNLQTHTPVSSTERSKDGSILVHTNRGDVRAAKVVYATNAYSASLLDEMKDLIIPVKGTVSSIPIAMQPNIDHTWGIKWTSLINNYMMRHENNFVIGGAKEVIIDQKENWYGDYDDSKMVPKATDYLYEFTSKKVLGFKDEEERKPITWTGIMGYSKDLMPFVGHRPGHPNEYMNLAHNGHGMPRVLLASRELAKLVLGEYKAETDLKVPDCMKAARIDALLGKSDRKILEQMKSVTLDAESAALREEMSRL